MKTVVRRSEAGAPDAHAAAERRRVERQGARILRAQEPERVHWEIATALSGLVPADLVAVLLPEADCAHAEGCERPECRGTLAVGASLGNAHPGFASFRADANAPWLGGARAEAGPVVVAPADGAPEGLTSAVVLAVGTPPDALLVLGSRRPREWTARDTERLSGIGPFVEGALAAAGARRNAEEAAILRERRRVAKELHDTVGQLLFGAGVAARLARESAGTGRPDGAERLLATEREIGRATAALRHALRALDGPRGTQGALPSSMSETIETFRHRTGVPTQLIVLGDRRGLGLDEERLLVMVVAEALNNVERHSGAAEVVVTLSFEEERVAVVVQDDGVGVASMHDRGTGFGLDHLREECGLRGGGLVLGANDDGGATLRAWISVGA